MEPVHPKMVRINELLENGFDVIDVSSDFGAVDVFLAKDDVKTTIRINRREAAELLWGRATPRTSLVTPA